MAEPTDTEAAEQEGTTTVGRLRKLGSQLAGQSSFWIITAFLLIAAIFTVLRPEAFFTGFNFTNIAINASILLIVAVGQTFVLASGGIDISVGSVLVFSSVISAMTMVALTGAGLPAWAAILLGAVAALAAGALWGAINGMLISFAKIPALIVTLGTMTGALGFAQIATGGYDIRGLPPELINGIGQGRLWDTIPVLVLIALGIAGIAAVALNMTRFGRYTLAIGSDMEAARRNGIRADLHALKIYVLVSSLAGAAGFLSVARFGTTTMGGYSMISLDSIAAVVLGGTSLFGGVATMLGTLIGSLIPTTLQNGFTILGVEAFWQQVAVGAVLIAAVAYDQYQRRRRQQL